MLLKVLTELFFIWISGLEGRDKVLILRDSDCYQLPLEASEGIVILRNSLETHLIRTICQRLVIFFLNLRCARIFDSPTLAGSAARRLSFQRVCFWFGFCCW